MKEIILILINVFVLNQGPTVDERTAIPIAAYETMEKCIEETRKFNENRINGGLYAECIYLGDVIEN